MSALIFLIPVSFIVLGAVTIYVARRNSTNSNPVPDEVEVVVAPPIRKTWVDHQVEELVNTVLQSIQQHPEKWSTWGVYSKGFGDKVTNFECSDSKMGVVIGPKGGLKYHAFRKATVEGAEEKQACWFEVPLTEYDTNRIQEAFVWLATTKSLAFLNKQEKELA
jgi:hypothetical protein